MTDMRTGGPDRSQRRIVLIVFGSIAALLALSYFYFLRPSYVPLYSELRPADASAIVAELDRQGVSYRLGDGGATILVPESDSASVRLAIAGSSLPLNGLVGFELFNESDLGLTDFTQKINYQRALQGELARTIMMMDGIENARVHLAIPERSLFRGARTETRAAVTVVPRRGRVLDEARVGGIQRLVASSVPDLALANVVVLDELGRVISSPVDAAQAVPPELEERAAAQAYYRARIRSAVEQIVPGHSFDIRVMAVTAEASNGAPQGSGTAAPGPGPGPRRQFRLRVTFLSSEPLDPEQQALVLAAARRAAELDEQLGDRLVFAVGPTDLAAVPPAPRPAAAPAALETGRRSPAPAVARSGLSSVSMLAAAAFLLLALILFARGRGISLAPADRESFVRRLRAELGSPQEEGRA
jgi:flagellar M-ring protein FliF